MSVEVVELICSLLAALKGVKQAVFGDSAGQQSRGTILAQLLEFAVGMRLNLAWLVLPSSKQPSCPPLLSTKETSPSPRDLFDMQRIPNFAARAQYPPPYVWHDAQNSKLGRMQWQLKTL